MRDLIPLFLEVRRVLLRRDVKSAAGAKAAKVTFPYTRDGTEWIEFLYVKEDWGWGRSGQTNAVTLNRSARDFFRTFF